jgi:hypothetical protein
MNKTCEKEWDGGQGNISFLNDHGNIADDCYEGGWKPNV